MNLYPFLMPVLHRMGPEAAHRAAMFALRNKMVPPALGSDPPSLQTQVFGLAFPNPIGLAAGFDKDAQAVDALLAQGFGFVEAGTVTLLAQKGNPKPRMFRLDEDRALINRLGFNSKGMNLFIASVKKRKPARGILGINIGRNKDAQSETADYIALLENLYPFANYITVNISSPNTPGLRALQERERLEGLLAALVEKRTALNTLHGRLVPLLVKIAPDLTVKQKEGIAEAIVLKKIDGLIISNTTIDRPDDLKNEYKKEEGGLSGAPLFGLSTHVLRQMYRMTEGKVPLIGVGGIGSGEDAYAKIRAGASLVQLYTALGFEGFGLIRRIKRELGSCLERDGFSSVSEAVGADISR